MNEHSHRVVTISVVARNDDDPRAILEALVPVINQIDASKLTVNIRPAQGRQSLSDQLINRIALEQVEEESKRQTDALLEDKARRVEQAAAAAHSAVASPPDIAQERKSLKDHVQHLTAHVGYHIGAKLVVENAPELANKASDIANKAGAVIIQRVR